MVGIGTLAIIIWGTFALLRLPVDAVPDITNNQVQVVTTSPSLAPQEVERYVTVPVELAVATVPDIVELRSISRFGLSVVTIVFRDGVDIHRARSQIDQRLADVAESIPTTIGVPMMAPITTGLGEIFQYVLRVDEAHKHVYDNMELRTIQDRIVRRGVLGVPGVADVSSFGGYVRQTEIAVRVDVLATRGITIADIATAVDRNSRNGGGAYIERGRNLAYVRTEGAFESLDDVRAVAVDTTSDGAVITIADIADVRNGSAIRYGALTVDDVGETAGGIVLMMKGANSSAVIHAVKERMTEISRSLPAGVSIEPFLDRTDLVDRAISTVTRNLVEGALIVIGVLVLMLGNMRAGIIVASVIPLSMLIAIGCMDLFGVSGNLMSLGAIDFGLIVDGAVIVVEHVLHALHGKRQATKDDIRFAATDIRRSAAFGEVVILIVYLPILALEGIEGKMFAPMAQTVIFAIIGAFVLSTTYVPMMASIFLRRSHSTWSFAEKFVDLIRRAYVPARNVALRKPAIVVVMSVLALGVAVFLFTRLGAEFIPQLDEGDFAVETRLPTGTSLSATVDVAMEASRILTTKFPEVERVVGKIGTSEIPLDPMPIEVGDLIVVLKPKDEWQTAFDRVALASAMERELSQQLPGVEFGFQQPIQMRFNELLTGARQDVVIKIFGDDMTTLQQIASEVGRIAADVPGATDVWVEPVEGLPQISIRTLRPALAAFSATVDDVDRTVSAAFAGTTVGWMFANDQRIDVVVRLDSTERRGLDDVRLLPIPTAKGIVPLQELADVREIEGPNQIQREGTRRRIAVGFNIRGRDVQSVVQDVQTRIAAEGVIPPGTSLQYGGQFENLSRALARLELVVPLSLLLIFLLLLWTFHDVGTAALIFTAVPLASIGGVAALWSRNMPFSISAGIGFIALFGVAVLNGIVLLRSFASLRQAGRTSIYRIVIEGTSTRLRPVVMTALVASLGFLPMAISTGDGAEVQRPLATVVIGGLVTSTLLTLVVLPILYVFLWKRRERRSSSTTSSSTSSSGTTPSATAAIFLMVLVSSMLLPSNDLAAAPEYDRRRAHERLDSVDISVRRARARVSELTASRLSAVDLGPTVLRAMYGQYNTAVNDLNITVEQTFPFPTRLAAGVDAIDAETDAAASQLRLEQRRIRAVYDSLWITLIGFQRQQEEIDSLLVIAQRLTTTLQAQQQAGALRRLDVLQVERTTNLLAYRRSEIQNNILETEFALRTLLDVDEASFITGPRELEELSTTIEGSSTLSLAYADAATTALSSIRAQRHVVTQNRLPDIIVGVFDQSLSGDQTISGVTTTYDRSDRFRGVTFGISVPLWQRHISAQLEAIDVRTMMVSEEQQRTLRCMDRRQLAARQRITAYITMLRSLQDSVLPHAEESVNLATLAWSSGDVSWADVAAALEGLHSTRLFIIDTRVRLAHSITELRTLTQP